MCGDVTRIIGELAHICRHCRECRDGVHGDVTGIVRESTHICRHCRECRDGVHGDVTGIVRESTHICRHCRNGWRVGQVVVVSAEAVARLFRIQCIRYAQQLLYALDAITDTAIGVNLGFEKIGTVRPVDAAEGSRHCGSLSYRQGHQAVDVGSHRLGLDIDSRARGTAL